MQKLTLLLALAIGLPQYAVAQAVSALHQGARIEVVSVNGKRHTGRLMSLRNDSLFYAPQGSGILSTPASLAFAKVESVRVSRGRNVFLSAVTKGLAGTVIGGITGAMLGAATHSKDDHGFFTSTRSQAAAFYGMLGGAGGLVVGTISGAAYGNERWERVELPRR